MTPTDPTAGGRPREGALRRLARFAVLHGAKRRALLALSAAAIGDFFVPALPTQTSVTALGLLQPQRAVWVALAFATATALGAALLALLLAGSSGYASQFGEARFGSDWQAVTERVRSYGVWAVLLASVFPTPPRLLVVATLLAGATAGAVVAAVFAGKLLWFGGFLLLLIHAPQRLARLPLLGPAFQRFLRFRAEVLGAPAAPGPGHGPSAAR